VQKLQNICKYSLKLGHTDTITLKKDVISMEKQTLFKWKHYQPDIILLTVRWYLRYNLSFRDLVEMMEERGLSIAHTTIMRWVHQYGPELDERVRPPTNDSWRADETYVEVNGQWMYLYRAVDSEGNTIDFYLSKTRNHKAAKRFFKKALRVFSCFKASCYHSRQEPSMLGFKSYETAVSILSGIEAMHMMKKGQLHQRVQSVQNEVKFIHKLFGIAS
jgi:transposase, IS6 family